MKSGGKKIRLEPIIFESHLSTSTQATNLIMIILVELLSIATSLEQALNEDVTSGADRATGDQQQSGVVEEEEREQMNE